MARPRTPIGTWGTINTRQLPTNTWEARAYLRTPDGRRRLISARGPSKTKATNRLKTRLADKATTTPTASNSTSPTTTIAQLCDIWIERKKKDEEVTKQTIADYEYTIRKTIRPHIGEITLRETTAGRISAFLNSLTPSTERRSRIILTQAFRLAKAHDAISCNPVEGLPKKRQRTKEVRALTLEELIELREGVRAWQHKEIDDNGQPMKEHDTQPRAWGLNWFIDLLLATGARPGELAATRWCDVNLESTPPTITIAATMISGPRLPLARQESTKTGHDRVLTLPPFAVQTLAEMAAERIDLKPHAPLFPSAKGGHRDPSSIGKQWRKARRAAGRDQPEKWEWVQLYTMRKTVATLIDRDASDIEAAAQLGHLGGTGVTRRHYIQARAAQAPDLSNILQRLAG